MDVERVLIERLRIVLPHERDHRLRALAERINVLAHRATDAYSGQLRPSSLNAAERERLQDELRDRLLDCLVGSIRQFSEHLRAENPGR